MSMQLTSESFKKLINESDKPVLVDFWATWCGPCRMLAPVIETLSEELEGQVVVAKLDVDNAQDIAVQYGVMSIPTIILFKDGVEAARTIGFQTKEKIKASLGI